MRSDAYLRGKIAAELISALAKARKTTDQITQAEGKPFHVQTDELLALIENLKVTINDSLTHVTRAEDLIYKLEFVTWGTNTTQKEKKKPPEAAR
jgi:hypothetical protein